MRTRKRPKMTLVIRVFPEDALRILSDLYKQKRLTESQYLSKSGEALALLKESLTKQNI